MKNENQFGNCNKFKNMKIARFRLKLEKQTMNKRSKHYSRLLFFLLSFFLWQSAAAQNYLIQSIYADSGKTGFLKLHSSDPIEKIRVDSLEIKYNPHGVIELPSGKHIIRARSTNQDNWFVRDWADTVQIEEQDTLALFISFVKYKMIYSEPFGATVKLDDRTVGKTPFLIKGKDLFSHRLSLSAEGYYDTLFVATGKSAASIWIPMKQRANFVIMQNNRLQQKKVMKRKRLRMSLVGFGAGIVAGSAAYLFKKEANRTYNCYLTSGNPVEFDNLFRRTEKYDRLAAGSYIVFEVDLLTSAYYFFRYLLDR